MAQTTTAITAIDSVFSVDNSGGTLTDISGSSNKVAVNLDNELGEMTTFGARWKIRTAGVKDVSIDFDIVWTTASGEARAILVDWYFNSANTARSVRVDTPNGSTGSQRIEGEFFLESLSGDLDSGSADPVMLSGTLRNTGAVTYDDSI